MLSALAPTSPTLWSKITKSSSPARPYRAPSAVVGRGFLPREETCLGKASP